MAMPKELSVANIFMRRVLAYINAPSARGRFSNPKINTSLVPDGLVFQSPSRQKRFIT
jgi:hypothetical protein